MVFELRSSEKSELDIFWLFRNTIQVSDSHRSQEKRLSDDPKQTLAVINKMHKPR